MEVLALYDFTASGEDELSFKKGDVLKVLGIDDNWYKAELQGCEGYVPKNYVDAHFPRWYSEDISRAEAESVLMAKSLGTFIIRSSQTSKGEFSISVRYLLYVMPEVVSHPSEYYGVIGIQPVDISTPRSVGARHAADTLPQLMKLTPASSAGDLARSISASGS
ncbi:GRB2-related adapter protein-like [Discoglossus pictus]